MSLSLGSYERGLVRLACSRYLLVAGLYDAGRVIDHLVAVGPDVEHRILRVEIVELIHRVLVAVRAVPVGDVRRYVGGDRSVVAGEIILAETVVGAVESQLHTVGVVEGALHVDSIIDVGVEEAVAARSHRHGRYSCHSERLCKYIFHLV